MSLVDADGVLDQTVNVAQANPLWLLLLTTLVGAIQGAAIGRRAGNEVDIVGMAVFALFLGLGGGLARDMLLGLPAAAIQSFWYPSMVLLGVALVYLFGKFLPIKGWLMVVLDALTLGLYAVVGTEKALANEVPWIGAIVVGLFASLTGGAIVSLLQLQRPDIIKPGSPYALLALGGVVIYLLLEPFHSGIAAWSCIGFVIISRVVSVRWNLGTRQIKPLPEA